MDFLHSLGLGTGELLVLGITAALIFLPSVVPAVGNALGRVLDRARGRTPEP